MGATVTYLLSIGLCLNWVTRTKMESLPRPTLSALPGSVIPKGANVTLRCQGHMRTDTFQLLVYGKTIKEKKASPDLAEFLLQSVDDWRDARSYRCRSGKVSYWSELSDPLALVVMSGTFPPPSISPSPHCITSPGTTVSISCQIPSQAPSLDYSVALLDAKSLNPLKHQSPVGTRTVFSLLPVRPEDSGSYSCIYYQKTAPHMGSHPSQSLHLTVTDAAPELSPSACPSPNLTSGANVSLLLWGPSWRLNFVLSQEGDEEILSSMKALQDGVQFFLIQVTFNHSVNYSYNCRSNTSENLQTHPSDPAQDIVKGSMPYNTIIITLSCVSFILLLLCLLLLAFICKGSISKGSLQGDSARRSLCCPYLPLNTCLSQQPEGLREEALNTGVTRERSRRPLVPVAEDIQGVTYAELNINMLNDRKTDHVKTPRDSTTYATVTRD